MSLEANTGNRVMLSPDCDILHADGVCKIIGAPDRKGSVIAVARCRVHRPYSWRQLTTTTGLISSCEISYLTSQNSEAINFLHVGLQCWFVD